VEGPADQGTATAGAERQDDRHRAPPPIPGRKIPPGEIQAGDDSNPAAGHEPARFRRALAGRFAAPVLRFPGLAGRLPCMAQGSLEWTGPPPGPHTFAGFIWPLPAGVRVFLAQDYRLDPPSFAVASGSGTRSTLPTCSRLTFRPPLGPQGPGPRILLRVGIRASLSSDRPLLRSLVPSGESARFADPSGLPSRWCWLEDPGSVPFPSDHSDRACRRLL